MDRLLRYIKILFLISLILIFTSCETKIDNTNQKSSSHSFVSGSKENQDSAEEQQFFGVWKLDKVVLKSRVYSEDITKNGDAIPINEEDYLGSEIEYTSEFLRFGDEKYFDPEYTLSTITVDNYDEDGKFRLTDGFPSLNEFVMNEGIKVDGMGKYENVGDIPLKSFEVIFKEDPYLEKYFIPVGTQCVLLNKDTMLIGVWGKIILAHRVEK